MISTKFFPSNLNRLRKAAYCLLLLSTLLATDVYGFENDGSMIIDTVDIQEDSIYTIVEEMPRFPGCDDKITQKEKNVCMVEKLNEFLKAKLIYPEKFKKLEIEGIEVVQFIVEKDGRITNIKSVRPLKPGFGFTDAACQAIKAMPNWIPGKEKGKLVRVRYTMPVRFEI